MEFHGAEHASAKSIVLIHAGLHAFGAGRRLSYLCATPSRFDAAINQDIYLGCYARSQEFLPVHLRGKNKYLLGMLSRHQGLRPRFRRKNNMAAQKFRNQSARAFARNNPGQPTQAYWKKCFGTSSASCLVASNRAFNKRQPSTQNENIL